MDAQRVATDAVVVGTWRRRTNGTSYDTLRLIRAGTRWLVRRSIGAVVSVHEFDGRSAAELEIANATRDCPECGGQVGFWVYYPPARRYRGAVAR